MSLAITRAVHAPCLHAATRTFTAPQVRFISNREINVPRAIFHKLYQNAECGICKKRGGKNRESDIFWFSPSSDVVHKKCFKKIEVSESKLLQTINSLFPYEIGSGQNVKAHIRAIAAVKEVCGESSIMEYMEKNDAPALAHLFNTVGIDAVYRYAKELQLK